MNNNESHASDIFPDAWLLILATVTRNHGNVSKFLWFPNVTLISRFLPYTHVQYSLEHNFYKCLICPILLFCAYFTKDTY